MKILLSMAAPHSSCVGEMLSEIGLTDVMWSCAENVEAIETEFASIQADVLLYDPGTPYRDGCERMAKAVVEQLSGKPIVFCSVSDGVWVDFLRKNGIWSPVINPYEHDDDFEACFTNAIEAAKQAARSVAEA